MQQLRARDTTAQRGFVRRILELYENINYTLGLNLWRWPVAIGTRTSTGTRYCSHANGFRLRVLAFTATCGRSDCARAEQMQNGLTPTALLSGAQPWQPQFLTF